MIIPANEFTDRRALDSAAVCIIGAGAAGITLACELDGCGASVILLESGGAQRDTALADDYRGAAAAPHPDPAQFRRAMFGGTTSLWGGRCVPFDPIDFERRDYIADSGWPISFDSVARHYPRAMRYCDAGAYEFTASGSIAEPRPTIEGFDGAGVVMTDCVERYSLPTDFGKRYRRQIMHSPNVLALLSARCTRLIKAPGEDRIQAVEFIDTSGQRRQVKAARFVLASGGIEAPRLLLGSDLEGVGLGNRYDLVGRFYSCHFENVFGRLSLSRGRVAFEFERTLDGVYCRRQLRMTPAAQREHRLLNTAFRLHFPEYSDASHGSAVLSAIYLAKSRLAPEYQAIMRHGALAPHGSPISSHLRNIALSLPELARFSYDWLFRMRLARRKLPYTLIPNADGSYPVEFNCEQTPLASNRITLGEDSDRHGMRRVQIAWRVSPEDVDAARRAFLLLRDVVNRSDLCRLEFDESRLYERFSRSVPLGGHHIGATRMGADPKRGVVDRDCAVFGLPNLYVAGASVFPTNSHANPTLTIVALAIRVAAHLRRGLAGAGPRPGAARERTATGPQRVVEAEVVDDS